MATQIADPLVLVNDDPVPITPNTLAYTEGLGEQTVRAASLGGGQTTQIYARNIETSFASVTFEMPAIIDNIERAKSWKNNLNNNVVQVAAETPEGTLTRTFTQASILNNYEVLLGSDTNITIEFKSNPAI